MKTKRLLTIICAASIVVALSVTAAFAAGAPGRMGGTRDEKVLPELTEEQRAEMEAKMTERKKSLGKLTDEQKAELEAKRAELEAGLEERRAQAEAVKEKWDALSDSEKEEIYVLMEASAAAQSAVIDKYLELGLISAESAAKMKELYNEAVANMRENGNMFSFSGAIGIGIDTDKVGGFGGRMPGMPGEPAAPAEIQ